MMDTQNNFFHYLTSIFSVSSSNMLKFLLFLSGLKLLFMLYCSASSPAFISFCVISKLDLFLIIIISSSPVICVHPHSRWLAATYHYYPHSESRCSCFSLISKRNKKNCLKKCWLSIHQSISRAGNLPCTVYQMQKETKSFIPTRSCTLL